MVAYLGIWLLHRVRILRPGPRHMPRQAILAGLLVCLEAIWWPIWASVAAQGPYSVAQALYMADIQHLSSICWIWLGWLGSTGFWDLANWRVKVGFEPYSYTSKTDCQASHKTPRHCEQ